VARRRGRRTRPRSRADQIAAAFAVDPGRRVNQPDTGAIAVAAAVADGNPDTLASATPSGDCDTDPGGTVGHPGGTVGDPGGTVAHADPVRQRL
jgi:hypothetical protein